MQVKNTSQVNILFQIAFLVCMYVHRAIVQNTTLQVRLFLERLIIEKLFDVMQQGVSIVAV